MFWWDHPAQCTTWFSDVVTAPEYAKHDHSTQDQARRRRLRSGRSTWHIDTGSGTKRKDCVGDRSRAGDTRDRKEIRSRLVEKRVVRTIGGDGTVRITIYSAGVRPADDQVRRSNKAQR